MVMPTNPILCKFVTRNFVNSLVPGRSQCDFKNTILSLGLLIEIFRFSYDIAFRWMPWGIPDEKSTLVLAMADMQEAIT